MVLGAPACAEAAVESNAYCSNAGKPSFDLIPVTKEKTRSQSDQKILELAKAEKFDTYLDCLRIKHYLGLASEDMWKTARQDLSNFNPDSSDKVEQYITTHQDLAFSTTMRTVAWTFANNKIKNIPEEKFSAPDKALREFAKTSLAQKIVAELPNLKGNDCSPVFRFSNNTKCRKPRKLKALGVYKPSSASRFFNHAVDTYMRSAAMFALGHSSGRIRYNDAELNHYGLINPDRERMKQFEERPRSE